MEIDEIRTLNDGQLAEALDEAFKGLMNLRFRVATMQLSNTNEVGKARKRIARINTVIRERELAKI